MADPLRPGPPGAVNIAEKLALVRDHWSPKTIGKLNDLDIKVVKIQGEFVWHTHDDTDELFLVVDGAMTIEMRDRPSVPLAEGDIFIVPAGVEHRPVAVGECHIVLVEPAGVVNTGDAGPSELTAHEEWV
jgi:mannose-6-phosphate isomerase-like protein (cupin superfamily)